MSPEQEAQVTDTIDQMADVAAGIGAGVLLVLALALLVLRAMR